MKNTVIKLYEGRDDVTLTTYVLQDSPDMLKSKNRPAILICPGGGYFSCSDREAEPVAMCFAAMGYHTFVLRYSVYGAEGGFPDLSKPVEPKEECRHPHPMNEIGMAMRIIADHSDEWHVDTDRIAVCGFSAGGHNAAMYGTHWHKDPENIRPAAMILGYPLTDYVYKHEVEALASGFVTTFFRGSDTAFLGTPEPSEDVLIDVSPARNITDNTPPAFIWATAADNLVPVQHSLIMARAMADAGRPYELHIFEEGDHGLSVATQASSSSWSECNKDAAGWIGLADKWLMKRFALDLPEKNDWEIMLEKGIVPGM